MCNTRPSFDESAISSVTDRYLALFRRVSFTIGNPIYLFLLYGFISLLFVTHVLVKFLKEIISKLGQLKINIPHIKHIKLPNIWLILAVIFFLLSVWSVWWFISADLPSPNELQTRNREVSTKIYDRNGVLLYKIFKNQNRTIIPLEKIPDHVVKATLAAEDAQFYNHLGFSIKGIIRAIIKNILGAVGEKEGRLTGGSTITQQLIKNALLSTEKTLLRKIREVILAIRVESTFTKDQILEMYLNEVSYGGTAYGIEEASQLYFGKAAEELTLAEAALLAGLPKSPSRYSPFGTDVNLAIERQKEVLNLMEENGFITTEEKNKAWMEELVFAQNRIDIKAPHFVMFVRNLLAEKFGDEVVEKGGLEVTTTLDYALQQEVEKIIREEIDKLGNHNVTNGAALVINPQTGEILAMVGSRDYFDTTRDGNVNVTLRVRSPGSSIKVVTYAHALSHGYTSATILSDTPVTFSVPGQPPYTPRNYDNSFRGNLTLRSAFAESRNIPAARTTAFFGVQNILEMGKKMGITTWNDPSSYGLSITLGGGGVKLVDLAHVYTTVANYGERIELSPIQKVVNYKGKVLQKNACADLKESTEKIAIGVSRIKCERKEIIDERVAYLLIDILKDNIARTPAFGPNSALVIPDHSEVAVKTGTSNDLRDNLTIGFNQDYLVATWVGNNDNSPMARIASGVTGAAPIFKRIMTDLLKGQENHPWPIPQGLVQLPICTFTGTLPCEGCPIKMEWFLEENQPKTHCSSETIKKINEERQKKKDEQTNPTRPGQILEPAFSTQTWGF